MVDICAVALSLVPFYCLFLFALIYLSLLFQLCCMIFILPKIHFKMRQGLNGVSIFGCKEYNQSGFGVDHLVMSMYRVFSCVVERGCLL